jgi:16S rRNA (cytosine967-C5)-methyltransferase
MQWTGSSKRNPDAKWKLKPEFIDNIRKIQSEVLESYSKIVKPGGRTRNLFILPSENQEQVQRFLTTEMVNNSILLRSKDFGFGKWF